MTATGGSARLRAAAALLFLCSVISACSTAAARRQVITIPGRGGSAPYSPAVRVGDLVFFSGVIGTDPATRRLAEGGTAAQVRQALENMRSVMTTAGVTPADLVKCTVFLVDIADYGAMNEAYSAFFQGTAPPARSAVAVNALPAGASVEIECIAAAK